MVDPLLLIPQLTLTQYKNRHCERQHSKDGKYKPYHNNRPRSNRGELFSISQYHTIEIEISELISDIPLPVNHNTDSGYDNNCVMLRKNKMGTRHKICSSRSSRTYKARVPNSSNLSLSLSVSTKVRTSISL